MEMGAAYEPLAGIVRAGPRFEKYGDDYGVACTVRWLSPDEAEVVGLVGRFDRDAWTDIVDCLFALGVERLIYHREHDGRRQRRVITRDRKVTAEPII